MKLILSIGALGIGLATTSLNAATLGATADGINYNYTSNQSSFVFSGITTDAASFDTSTSYFGLCLDRTKNSYWDLQGGTNVVDLDLATETIPAETLEDVGMSNVWGSSTPANQAMAIGQLGWLIDNHFADDFKNGTADQRSAFAQVVWEITGDGGAGNPLDFAAGNNQRDFTGGAFASIQTEMDSILASVNGAGVDFSTYTWQADQWIVKVDDLSAQGATYDNQDYLLVSFAIPEPSSALLASLACVVGLMRRRR